MKYSALTLLSLFLSVTIVNAQAVWDYGSQRPETRDNQWRFSLGSILYLDGNVDETFRAFYAATGQDQKQALAESYDLKDFNIKCPYYTLGVHYNCEWEFFNYRWNLSLFKIASDAVAKRNYYIGVGDEISYHGKKYDHMVVPKGEDFSLEFIGMMTDFTFGFTPFTFFYGPEEDIRLTPSLDLGIVLLGGMYEIDAGSPRGTTVYQNPPVDFVIGGDSRSFIGAGAPKIGLGADLIVGPDKGTQWKSHADIGYFMYDGSTKLFTQSADREKDLELTFFSMSLETGFLFPFEDGTAFSVGVNLQLMNIDGEIRSKEKENDRIIKARERFDKSAEMTMVNAFIYLGYAF